MIEKNLERAVVEACNARGWVALKVGFDGWPDRLILTGDGRHYWVELKAQKGRLRAVQKVRKAMLERMGEVVLVARTAEEAFRLPAGSR